MTETAEPRHAQPDGGARQRRAAEYLIASKKCNVRALEQLLCTGAVVGAISNLIHALQAERGASNGFVASGGTRFHDILTERVAETERHEAVFLDRLDRLGSGDACAPGDSRLFARLAEGLHGLEEVAAARASIRRLEDAPDAILARYSTLIDTLLAAVFEAADGAVDPQVSHHLVAMFHLMRGKELAGRERALGAARFAGEAGFDAHARERLRALIDAQERCFRIFTDFAGEGALAEWQRHPCDPPSRTIERLRRLAFSGPEHADPLDADLGDSWFEEATRRIDALKGVEDVVAHELHVACRGALWQAREELAGHQAEIEQWSRPVEGAPAFTVFSHQGDVYEVDCGGPQLGRSLVELLQAQAERLERMGEELEEARSALSRRKTVEKAKGLIMKHRGIPEDQAYRFLQEAAMAQGRRLSDVAADALQSAGLFGALGSSADGGSDRG